MGNFDSNYSIAQEISARIGNSPIPFDSVYSICLQIYKDLGGTESNFDSVYSILLEILPIVQNGVNAIVDVDELPDATLNKDKIVRYNGDLYYPVIDDSYPIFPEFPVNVDAMIVQNGNYESFLYVRTPSEDTETEDAWCFLDVDIDVSMGSVKQVNIFDYLTEPDTSNTIYTVKGSYPSEGDVVEDSDDVSYTVISIGNVKVDNSYHYWVGSTEINNSILITKERNYEPFATGITPDDIPYFSEQLYYTSGYTYAGYASDDVYLNADNVIIYTSGNTLYMNNPCTVEKLQEIYDGKLTEEQMEYLNGKIIVSDDSTTDEYEYGGLLENHYKWEKFKIKVGSGLSIDDSTNTMSVNPSDFQFINVTYNQLVSLRNQGKLIPGAQYCITNYVTSIKSSLTDFRTTNRTFQVIVTANKSDALNENARCYASITGGYFQYSKVNAWEIKYCLDNDIVRFPWASQTGSGVIYYMKDEFGNECPYDFKTIQIKSETNNKFYYTFSLYDENSNTVYDASIRNFSDTDDVIKDFKIKEFYVQDISHTYHNILPKIIFIFQAVNNTILLYNYNNVTIDGGLVPSESIRMIFNGKKLKNIHIGCGCSGIFVKNVTDLKIGNSCSNIYLTNDNDSNDGWTDIVIKENCQAIRFVCSGNSQTSLSAIVFGSGCHGIYVENYSMNNITFQNGLDDLDTTGMSNLDSYYQKIIGYDSNNNLVCKNIFD